MQLQIDYGDKFNFGVKELKNFEKEILESYNVVLQSSSLFLIPFSLDDSNGFNKCDTICKEISRHTNFRSKKVYVKDLNWGKIYNVGFCFQELIFDNISPDKLKKILLNSFQKMAVDPKYLELKMNKTGLFFPRLGKISCFSFAHGEGHYYRYRLAEFKLKSIHGILHSFLSSLSSLCPNQYFLSGSRASNFNIELNINLKKSNQHDVINFAIDALKERKLKSEHEDIEKYFLETDPDTIACEVPLWFEPKELSQFKLLKSNTDGTLTGHIDILRYDDNGNIGIWDYKPNAVNEKSAHIQVYLYALMLSIRINFPLEKITCGYFDSKVAFYFNAKEININ